MIVIPKQYQINLTVYSDDESIAISQTNIDGSEDTILVALANVPTLIGALNFYSRRLMLQRYTSMDAITEG